VIDVVIVWVITKIVFVNFTFLYRGLSVPICLSLCCYWTYFMYKWDPYKYLYKFIS